MMTRFNRLKLTLAVSTALMTLTGCNDSSTSITPIVDNSDNNPWVALKGAWAQPGAGKAILVGTDDIVLFEYNQNTCIEMASFDFTQGLAQYASIERSAQGQLMLQATSQDSVQKYDEQTLPDSCAEPLSAADINALVTFDYVWQALSDYYAHFDQRNIDWQQVYQKYSPQITTDSTDEQLQQVLAQMIGDLQDANVVLDTGDTQLSGDKKVPLLQAAKATAATALAYGETLSVEQALAQLQGIYLTIQQSYVSESSWQQWPEDSPSPSIAWGLSDNNVGLLVLNNLKEFAQAAQGNEPLSDAEQLEAANTLLAQAKADLDASDGLIIDLRDVKGGSDTIAMAVVELFAATSLDTFSSHISNAQYQSDDTTTYTIEGNESAYQKPVYVIVSQGTVGAAEQIAIALKSQSHVKIVGEATAGALSTPIELTLPNGWQLSLPNTKAQELSGETLSVVGISPHIPAPAYTQTSTRELKFESYQRALVDLGKFQHPAIPVADYEMQMKQLMSDGLIPGAAVAVVKGGEIVYSQGFGKADEQDRAVTPDTPFFVASVSKTLLGTTIAQAEAHGLLSLSDEVEGVPGHSPLGFDISYPGHPEFKPTFAHLVTHTAGLVDDSTISLCTYYFDDDNSSVANWFFGQAVCPETINPSLGEHLQQYLDSQGAFFKPSNFTSNYGVAPGTVNRYSNYGAALAGYALQAKTGKSLAELTQEYVIAPLGLTNTHWSSEGIAENTARRYIVGPDGVAVPLREYRSVTYPDGGAISSAHDLAKYVAAASNGGIYQGQQRLKAAGIEKMLTSQSDVPTTERGIGYFWRLDGDYFSHNGGDFGVLADVWADKHHDIAVVLLTNGDVLHGPAIGSMIGMFAASKALAYGYVE